MKDYKSLTDAQQIVSRARYEIYKEEGSGSAAWQFLLHVSLHLNKQADSALRGGE